MQKELIVNRQSFLKEYLDAMTAFGSNNEFLPIRMYKGKLVTFCHFEIKDSKGLVGMNIEFTPESTNMVEGDVFYIKNPMRLKKSISTFSNSELLHIKVTSSQIISKCDDIVFTSRLYDPILAETNGSFWKPEKFDKIKSTINKGIVLSPEKLKMIKDAVNMSDGDFAIYENDESNPTLTIGDSTQSMVKMDVEYSDALSEKSEFNKNLFLFVGKNKAMYTEAMNNDLVLLVESSDFVTKYYFIPKKIDS